MPRNIGSRTGLKGPVQEGEITPFRSLGVNVRNGSLDDAAGTLTGTANQRLYYAPQQAAAMLLKWVPGLTTSEVTVPSPTFGGSKVCDTEFHRWVAQVKSGGLWYNQFQIYERAPIREHLNRFVRWFPLMITEGMDGTIRFIPYPATNVSGSAEYFTGTAFEYHPNYPDDTDYQFPYALWDMEISLTPISEVYNRFRIRYWQFREGDPLVYEQVITEVEADCNVYDGTSRLNDGTPTDLEGGLGFNLSSLCANSQALYNVQRELVIDMPNISEHAVATAQLAYLCKRFSSQRLIVKARTGQESIDLKPGHWVQLENAVNRVHPFLDYHGEPAKGTGWKQANVNTNFAVSDVTIHPAPTGVEVEFTAEQMLKFVTSEWVPEQKLDLLFDFKAEDIAADNGDDVAAWSGGDGITASQATAAKQPTYVANSLNGLPGLDFDTTEVLITTDISSAAGSFAFWMVVHPTSVATDQYFFDSQTGRVILSNSRTLNVGHFDGGWKSYGAATAAAQLLVWVFDADAPGAEVFRNGTSIGTATYTSTALGGSVGIGGEYTGNNNARYNGLIYRMGCTATLITTDERERVEGYLAHRYGLDGSLPGGHNYKSAPPK